MQVDWLWQDRARSADCIIRVSISPGKANGTEDEAVTGAEAAHSTSRAVEAAAANEEQHEELGHVAVICGCSEFFRAQWLQWKGKHSTGSSIVVDSADEPMAKRSKADHPDTVRYMLDVELEDKQELSSFKDALHWMYFQHLPVAFGFEQLTTLMTLSNKLQAPLLEACIKTAWEALPHSELSLSLTSRLLSSAAVQEQPYPAWMLDSCQGAWITAVSKDKQKLEPCTCEALQVVLGDALAIANTPRLQDVLDRLPDLAMLHWLQHMEGLTTDSEDTVLHLVNWYLFTDVNPVGGRYSDMVIALQAVLMLPQLSALYATAVLPLMRWAWTDDSMQLLMQYREASDDVKAAMHKMDELPASWLLPPRPVSCYKPPPPQLTFNRDTLAAALLLAKQKATNIPNELTVPKEAHEPATVKVLEGVPSVQHGLRIYMQLTLVLPLDGSPIREYQVGLRIRALVSGVTGVVAASGRMLSGSGKDASITGCVRLNGGIVGVSNWWHGLPEGMDPFHVSAWEHVFMHEGPQVDVQGEEVVVRL